VKRSLALFLALSCPTGFFAQGTSAAQNNSGKAQASAATQRPADAAAPPTPSSVDPAKEAAIRKLFEAVGTKELVTQMLGSTLTRIKPLVESSLPPGEYRAELVDLFFQRFQSKFTSERLLTLLVSVYDKHFSLDEVEGLTQFYQTPLGKKAVSVLPQVVSECQEVGAKLGEEVGRESMLELLAERPDLKKSMEQAASAKNP
jgi:uncharacterized protein